MPSSHRFRARIRGRADVGIGPYIYYFFRVIKKAGGCYTPLRRINIIVLCGAVCELRVIVMHPTKERHSHTAVPFFYVNLGPFLCSFYIIVNVDLIQV